MEKKKTIFLWLLLTLVLFVSKADAAYAAEMSGIEAYVGTYLCDLPEYEEYSNPDVLSLYFNENGNLERCHRLYFSTIGSTRYYEYSSYTLDGNILTCDYNNVRDEYGDNAVTPSCHCFILTEEGNLVEENHVWYRTDGTSDTESASAILSNAMDLDFPTGIFSTEASFLGMEGVFRGEIEEITFLDTMAEKPATACDVSEAGDGSVVAWVDRSEGICHVFIAADGTIKANRNSSNLFRCCTSVKIIDFNGVFDTGDTYNMANLFNGCVSLERIGQIEELDTENVSDMSGMFTDCGNLLELNLSNFQFNNSGNYEEIFAGTRWENRSPLLDDYRGETLTVQCILDIGSLITDDSALRYRLFSAYDQKLADIYSEYSPEYNIEAPVYTLVDINSDGIPELFVLQAHSEGVYSCNVFTFNADVCQMVGNEDITLYLSEPTLYYHEKEQMITYSEQMFFESSGTDASVTVEKGKIYKRVDIDKPESEGKLLQFRYILPKKVAEEQVDLDGDGRGEEIDAYLLGGNSGFDYLAVYVDSIKAFEKNLDVLVPLSNVYISSCVPENGVGLLNVQIPWADYSYILKYEDGKFREFLGMGDLIDEVQLFPFTGLGNCSTVLDIVKEFQRFSDKGLWRNNFTIEIGEKEGEVRLNFDLATVTFGQMSFSMDYEYSDGAFIQKSFLYEFDDDDLLYWDYCIQAEELKIYNEPGNATVKDTWPAGTEIYLDQICMADGFLWVRAWCETETCSGWIPVGASGVFEESVFADLEPGMEKIKLAGDASQFFELDTFQNSEQMYELGLLYWEAAEKNDSESDEYFMTLDMAMFYLNLVDKESTVYQDAQIKIASCKEKVADACYPYAEELCYEEEYGELYRELMMAKDYLPQDERYEYYLNICRENDAEARLKETQVAAALKVSELQRSADEARQAFFQEAAVNNAEKEYPDAYCSIDLNQDGIEEIIVREYPSYEEETYYYSIYRYNSEEKRFVINETFETGKKEDAVFWWARGSCLLLDKGEEEQSLYVYYKSVFVLWEIPFDMSGLSCLAFY